MEYLKDFYYGLWSQISDWPQMSRAALVMAVVIVLLWIISVLFFPKILKLGLSLIQKMIQGIYLFFSDIIFPFLFKKKYIYIANKFSDFMENGFNFLSKFKKRLRKRLHIGKFIILYLFSLLLIATPSLLSSTISPEYLNVISIPYNIYDSFEKVRLEISSAYSPIVVEKNETENQMNLDKKTITQDVNFREGPGKSHNKIGVLYKNTIIYYLDEDGEWCKVKTEEGTIGWVHGSYLQNIDND